MHSIQRFIILPNLHSHKLKHATWIHLWILKDNSISQVPNSPKKDDDKGICCICGNKGFTNALLDCSNCCEIFAHQYCLGISPGSIDDTYTWLCEDCCGPMASQSVSFNDSNCAFSDKNELIIVEDQPQPLQILLPESCNPSPIQIEASNESECFEKILRPFSSLVAGDTTIDSPLEHLEEFFSEVVLVVSPEGEVTICKRMNFNNACDSYEKDVAVLENAALDVNVLDQEGLHNNSCGTEGSEAFTHSKLTMSMHKKAETQDDITDSISFDIRSDLAPVLRKIIVKQGDIFRDCIIDDSLIVHFCEAIQELQKVTFTGLQQHHVDCLRNALKLLEDSGAEAIWLRKYCDYLQSFVPRIMQYTDLMRELVVCLEKLQSGEESLNMKRTTVSNSLQQIVSDEREINSLKQRKEQLEQRIEEIKTLSRQFHKMSSLADGIF